MGQYSIISDFTADIHSLLQLKEKYSGTLEEYLRSLWQVINTHKDTQITYELTFLILREAFEASSLEFDKQWLNFDTPLQWSYIDGEYVIEAWDKETNKPVIAQRGVSDFEILTGTILFQIADLHRMKDNQLKNEWRYMGVTSPTGNSWYNFDVFTYLECGISGFKQEAKLQDCDWVFLASLLELGRLYE